MAWWSQNSHALARLLCWPTSRIRRASGPGLGHRAAPGRLPAPWGPPDGTLQGAALRDRLQLPTRPPGSPSVAGCTLASAVYAWPSSHVTPRGWVGGRARSSLFCLSLVGGAGCLGEGFSAQRAGSRLGLPPLPALPEQAQADHRGCIPPLGGGLCRACQGGRVGASWQDRCSLEVPLLLGAGV